MRLRGEELLLKIESVHNSRNLFTYKGNLREVAVACGYMKNTNQYNEKISQQIFDDFCLSYWRSIKKSKRRRYKGNNVFDNYKIFYTELQKKYKHIPTEKEVEEKRKADKERKARRIMLKSNPRPKSGSVNQYFDEELKKTYEEREKIKKSNNISDTKTYEQLTGFKLLDEVLELKNMGKGESSICVITGYKIDKIGTFRRSFAKAAGVQLAPLNRMIREMREQELLSKDSLEGKESKDLFIDREKITTQVKRRYRNPKFREKVLKMHGSICSCCNIAMEELIEAAHIIPVENNGNDNAENGIPLCPTHHTAFDNFLFAINPSNNSIIFKDGLLAEKIQITKTKCELKVSKESLEYRYKLFNED